MKWNEASEGQKSCVFRQMKNIYLELEKLPNNSIGSPFIRNDAKVDIDSALFDYDENRTIIPHYPFTTSMK